MTNDISIHIVNHDSAIMKLIHDSFSIFVDKHTATIENPMWFVATDKGTLKVVTDANFKADYIKETK